MHFVQKTENFFFLKKIPRENSLGALEILKKGAKQHLYARVDPYDGRGKSIFRFCKFLAFLGQFAMELTENALFWAKIRFLAFFEQS